MCVAARAGPGGDAQETLLMFMRSIRKSLRCVRGETGSSDGGSVARRLADSGHAGLQPAIQHPGASLRSPLLAGEGFLPLLVTFPLLL